MEIKMSEKSETRAWPNIFGFGLLMGTADAVPGVSGGTIALIIGIYQRLISSISTCLVYLKDKFPSKSTPSFFSAFNFLFPLGCGMLCSYYIVTKILIGPEDSPGFLRQDTTGPYIFAFFFGLVLFSIKEPWNLVSEPDFKHYLLAVIGVLVVFIYTSFSLESSDDSNVLLIVGGVFALTAMLLPGVSGALVLLTLGQYHSIASSFHGGSLEPLMYLILGGIIGLFTFVPFMQYMISEYIDNTMAILAGLMCGSLITLWPWKTDYDVEGLSPNIGLSQVFDDFALVSIILTFIFFMGGIATSYGLKQLEVKNES
jgi:putative membrane protein